MFDAMIWYGIIGSNKHLPIQFNIDQISFAWIMNLFLVQKNLLYYNNLAIT